jgi:hypothetical protein
MKATLPGAASCATPGMQANEVLRSDHELAALDGKHLEGIYPEAVVVLG